MLTKIKTNEFVVWIQENYFQQKSNNNNNNNNNNNESRCIYSEKVVEKKIS